MESLKFWNCNITDQNNKEQWDELCLVYGSPFQTTRFLEILKNSWSGEMHSINPTLSSGEKIIAALPLFKYTSCPRLDYYKSFSDAEIKNLLFSHNLVGWDGFPFSLNEDSTIKLLNYIDEFLLNESIIFIAGLDYRNKGLLNILASKGYYISQFHSNTIRKLNRDDKQDPTMNLSKKRRGRIRSCLSKASHNGITLSEFTLAYLDPAIKMIQSILIKNKMSLDLLPKEFLLEILTTPPPGLDPIIALNEDKILQGIHINFHWNDVYYIWLAGHELSTLNMYQQSHYLFNSSIKRAANLGCKEIHAGRDPFSNKKQHGFEIIPIYAAIKGKGLNYNKIAVEWLDTLSKRHLVKHFN